MSASVKWSLNNDGLGKEQYKENFATKTFRIVNLLLAPIGHGCSPHGIIAKDGFPERSIEVNDHTQKENAILQKLRKTKHFI